MLLTVLEFRKIGTSICIANHMEVSLNEQMYYASRMISQICAYEYPKIERESNDTPIIRLSFDKSKNEFNIFSSEDEKETIEILASSILLNLIS